MKKLIVLLTIVVVLGLSGMVTAEGNWILWEKYYIAESKVPNVRYQPIVLEEWRIIEAFENKRSCSADLDRRMNDYVKDGWKINRDHRGVYRPSPTLPETTTHLREFICLPESVDPRKEEKR